MQQRRFLFELWKDKGWNIQDVDIAKTWYEMGWDDPAGALQWFEAGWQNPADALILAQITSPVNIFNITCEAEEEQEKQEAELAVKLNF